MFVQITFTRLFYNKQAGEVAGIWYDSERGQWRVSTVPILGFGTEESAVNSFYRRCDPETGLMVSRSVKSRREDADQAA